MRVETFPQSLLGWWFDSSITKMKCIDF